MAKQVLEIEVPDGKKAVWKNNRIYFEDVDTVRRVRTIEEAIDFLRRNKLGKDIQNTLRILPRNSYEWKIAAYRAVVIAVTYNERFHLTIGERWYPTIEYCLPEKLTNCSGKTIVGRIRSEEREFDVVSGCAYVSEGIGLGCFSSGTGKSAACGCASFLLVSSKETALYISEHFGKLLFEVSYGGTNCDWRWVEYS